MNHRLRMLALLGLHLAARAAFPPLDSTNAPPGEGLYLLHSTRFTGNQLPEEWDAVGAWRVDEGLLAPAPGSPGTYAVWNRQTALENTLVEVWFVLPDRDSRLGVVRRDISRPFTRADVAGSLGVLDAATGTLAIHAAWDGTNAAPPLVQRRLPFALLPGREYKLALWKTDAGHHTLGLWDTVTGERGLVATVRRPGHDPGKQLDAPGVWCERGPVRFTRLDFSTAFPPRPRLLVLGDSNSEGEALKPDYESRYCKLALTALNGNAVLAARGRETTASLRTRLDHDLDRFRPEFVLLLLGTSELSFEAWREHLDPVLERIEARGAEPVLATIPPADHRAEFNRRLNAAVRTLGRPYAEFARVLSRDADGVYWNFGLQLDGIHPNPAGNRLMFERLRADVPQIFASPRSASPARYRQVRLPSTTVTPGDTLVLPLELTTTGRENLLAVSLEWDPAFLRYLGADAGADLPPGARVDLATDQTALGLLGLWLEWPPDRSPPPGLRTLVQLRFRTSVQPPASRTRVRFSDEPQPRLLLDFGLESWLEAELTFPHPEAPAAAWSLDGDVRDRTQGGRDGNLAGGTWVPARLGSALFLNGTGDGVDWPVLDLPLATAVSVTAWIRPDSVGQDASILRWDTDPPGELVLKLVGGHYRFGWIAGAPGSPLASGVAPPADTGRWVHLAGVLDGAVCRLFRNGVEWSQIPVTGRPVRLLRGRLGAGANGPGQFFRGGIDEVRLFDRPLTDWEVRWLADRWTAQPGADEVWLDDALPPGAVGLGHGGDTGEWVMGDPPPVSGARALRSPAAAGLHGYYFGGHAPGWRVEAGDALVAYVHLDPLRPPRMILLQWQDETGSWEHRAFWGEALWPFGRDTPLARHDMGPLPPTGVWTRLEVPAAWVGLEGRRVQGLGVAAYDGTVHWDHLGCRRAVTDWNWLTETLPTGAEPDLVGGQPWQWETGTAAPFDGLPVHGSATVTGLSRHGWVDPAASFPVEPGTALFAWVQLKPDAEPDLVGLEWQDETGSREHRAWWGESPPEASPGETAGWRRVGPLPVAGRWVRLQVPAGLVGLSGRRVTGQTWFSRGGIVRWGPAGVALPGFTSPESPRLRAVRATASSLGIEFDLPAPMSVTVEESSDLRGWWPRFEFEGAAGRNAWRSPVAGAGAWYRLRVGPQAGAARLR